MKCSNPDCGRELRDGYKMCPYCGTFFSNKKYNILSGDLPTATGLDKVFSVNGIPVTMILVKGGSFNMGFTQDQILPQFDDKTGDPVHAVTVKDFYLAETPVTQKLWKSVMGNNPSKHLGDELPVENISWFDAHRFVMRLNELTGRSFRLPTEEEWEYAARGGLMSGNHRFSGSDDLDEVAWYNGNGDHVTHPVKEKKANELGLYDMTGNVKEWCNELYLNYSNTKDYWDESLVVNVSIHPRRGGGFSQDPDECQNAFRDLWPADLRNDDCGLRLAMSTNSDIFGPPFNIFGISLGITTLNELTNQGFLREKSYARHEEWKGVGICCFATQDSVDIIQVADNSFPKEWGGGKITYNRCKDFFANNQFTIVHEGVDETDENLYTIIAKNMERNLAMKVCWDLDDVQSTSERRNALCIFYTISLCYLY